MTDNPYASSSFIGHSLWMVPSGSSRDAYQSIIQNASQEFNTLSFTPHITLAAAIMTSPQEVVERTKILASQLAPYEFEFESMGQKDLFFQCVFAKMKSTKQVLHANQVARQVFPERQQDPEYMPHMSLVYGNLTEKESLIASLSKQIEEQAPATTKIAVDSIQVWSTQGYASEWYLVETVPLMGNSES